MKNSKYFKLSYEERLEKYMVAKIILSKKNLTRKEYEKEIKKLIEELQI